MNTLKLLKAVVFGSVFGFLLQKGGVADFHILLGALLLEDFTVVKIMLSAVVVGIVGVVFLKRAGLVELSIKPLRPARNIVGGLIFGAGFALSAYCPGTGAAAAGQLNADAFYMIAGMIAGSYLYALVSGQVKAADAREPPKKRLVGDSGLREIGPALAIASLLAIVTLVLSK
ncbi:YeeE/YedE thiosulfate transporter family protein [Pelagicoccus sp. SDUM812002]|uniref:YeeE/YedE thiosulfate transporter family protein n=1 Tax=Pelagicoccus sp. SDUM812002 TaxID=3041266 RepID=UPI00280EB88B|nr:YeeE/YedE thiosulfate transporter family protein [Pelagicoccus sp. SDUM812002]MDQ8186798.1 YeeE/YedE thiosulfate transporter family protein [Pelagicoccus sp. SDUM812002]